MDCTPTDAPPLAASTATHPWQRWLLRGILWVVLADVAVAGLLYGLQVRRAVWDTTRALRFYGDSRNRYIQGYRADRNGGAVAVFNMIDAEAASDTKAVKRRQLDYTPLRLAVMTWWYRWTQDQPQFRLRVDEQNMRRGYGEDYYDWRWRTPFEVDDNVRQRFTDYEFNKPLLQVNTACELAAALGAFALVMIWVSRAERRLQSWPVWTGIWLWHRYVKHQPVPVGPPRRPWIEPVDRGAILGLAAGLLVWFNPAILMDSHAWPQWDVWALPAFLWAAVFASLDVWLLAGACLAVGAMFKGQLLMVAPFFVLWPLFAGRWWAVLHVLTGFALAGAFTVWPWLYRDHTAETFLWRIGLAWLLVAPWAIVRKRRQPMWLTIAGVASVAAVALVAAPWLARGSFAGSAYSLLAAGAVLALVCFVPARQMPIVLLAVFAAGLWLCIPLYDGSVIWYRVGFEFGVDRYPDLVRYETNNLAYLLSIAKPNAWTKPGQIVWNIRPYQFIAWPSELVQVTAHRALSLIYMAGLVLSAAAAAIQSRRKDARILVAIVAPWALMFAFAPQMHQRYLLWAAGAGAVLVAVGVLPLACTVLLSLLGASMILHSMLEESAGAITPTFPGRNASDYQRALERSADKFAPGWLRDFFSWMKERGFLDSARPMAWMNAHRSECAKWAIAIALFLLLWSLIPRPRRRYTGDLPYLRTDSR